MTTVALLVAAANAFSNNVPVYGTYPGWGVGSGRTGISVEIYLDLLCSDSQANNPIWEELLATPWLDGTVQDQVFWHYTNVPLPYHVHAFQVGQVVPYLQYLCAVDANQCGALDQYKDFCYEQLDTVLSWTDVSQDDFIAQWSQMVAEELSIDEQTILGLYDRDTDIYNTNMNVRAMWKYATSKGVSGTPTAYINGVRLDSLPSSVNQWLNYLQ